MTNKRKFYRQLLIIALPMMFQYVITSMINLSDSFMIGRLGDDAVAALGICNQYFFFFNIIAMGITSGCGVVISQLWGRKDVAGIRRVLGISLVLCLATGAVFMLAGLLAGESIIMIFSRSDAVISLSLSYLEPVCIGYIFIAVSYAFGIASRSINRTVMPMICSAGALVINIFLNYALIFGHFGLPEMGVRGSAIATLLARAFEMIVMLLIIYSSKGILAARLEDLFGFNRLAFKRTMRVLSAVVLNEMCWGIGAIVYSVIYGNMGTQVMAAFQIYITVQNVFMIMLFAVAGAASVMVGNEIGKGDKATAADFSARLIRLTWLIGIIMGVGLITCTGAIMSIYDVSAQVSQCAHYMLFLTGLILPVRFVSILLIVGILRGGGDVDQALRIELATMWLLGVPLSVICAYVLKCDVQVVFAAAMLEEILKLLLCMKRYRSGLWMKDVVHGEDMASFNSGEQVA